MILVYLAVLLTFLLLPLAGVAIDLSYMYFVKNELQVAADAAAMEGAALISDSNDLIQPLARNKAKEFAAKNKAAGIPVTVITDSTNNLSDNNDITVGNWNNNQYIAGGKPVNAIEVRPKRLAGLSGNRGSVSVFIGQISGWSSMSATASAVGTMGMVKGLTVPVLVR